MGASHVWCIGCLTSKPHSQKVVSSIPCRDITLRGVVSVFLASSWVLNFLNRAWIRLCPQPHRAQNGGSDGFQQRSKGNKPLKAGSFGGLMFIHTYPSSSTLINLPPVLRQRPSARGSLFRRGRQLVRCKIIIGPSDL